MKVRQHVRSHFPNNTSAGYFIDNTVFVSNHFGDHKQLKNSLKIPHGWHDPDNEVRSHASAIIDQYIRPRTYILDKANAFIQENTKGVYTIGVHIRGTDVTDKNQHNVSRRGTYNLQSYEQVVNQLLKEYPEARIFVATDSLDALTFIQNRFSNKVIHQSSVFHIEGKVTGKGPMGWGIPAYLSEDTEKAAKNGEEAIIDYLILSQCQYLVHNGSGLPRTALLKNPDLKHTNIHSKKSYVKKVATDIRELPYLLKVSLLNVYRKLKNSLK